MAKLLGKQKPRLSNIPDGDTARGDAAVEFARQCGMTLYLWQEDLLRDMCRTVKVTDDETGEEMTRWSAREVVVVVPRQNGKGEVLVARELAGIFLFDEKIIFHSAHRMDTVEDAQKRLWEVIERNPDLMNWWLDDPDFDVESARQKHPKVKTGNGKEQISFPNGAVIYFRTRSNGTGRGLSIDYLILDECYDLPSSVWRAMGKTTSAVPNSQKIFISSPVDRTDPDHVHGRIFSAKRWAGIDGAKKILFKEWSMREDGDPFAFESWAEANPSLVSNGPGQQLDDMATEAESAKNSEDLLEGFLVESLAVGNWYPRDGEAITDFTPVISSDDLDEVMTTTAPTLSYSVISVDAAPDGSKCSIALAGRAGPKIYGMVGYHGPLIARDVVDAVLEVCQAANPMAILIDPKSPAEVLIDKLDAVGLEVTTMKWPEVKSSTRAFLQGVDDRDYLLAESQIIRDSFDCAELREDSEGGVAWQRRSGVICQLVALSAAMWGVSRHAPLPKKGKAPAARNRTVKRRAMAAGMKF